MPEGTEEGSTEQKTETTQTETTQTTGKEEAKFTQAELDAILKQRLARAVPADYEDLKTKAGKLDALEAGQKTELDKAIERANRAEAKTSQVEANANSKLKRAAIMVEAAKQNSSDAEVVVALLVSSEDITVDKEGNVEGVEAAVKKLLKDKPILGKANAGASGGEFGGNAQKTIDEQIAEAEKKGDVMEAMRLKMAKSTGQ